MAKFAAASPWLSLVDGRDQGVRAETDHPQKAALVIGIAGGCSGRPSGMKLAPPSSVDLGEDCSDPRKVVLDRLQQDTAPDSPHAHFCPGHGKFLRLTHRLTAAELEKFCCPGLSHSEFTLA
jgi:hypothetical protein